MSTYLCKWKNSPCMSVSYVSLWKETPNTICRLSFIFAFENFNAQHEVGPKTIDEKLLSQSKDKKSYWIVHCL